MEKTKLLAGWGRRIKAWPFLRADMFMSLMMNQGFGAHLKTKIENLTDYFDDIKCFIDPMEGYSGIQVRTRDIIFLESRCLRLARLTS